MGRALRHRRPARRISSAIANGCASAFSTAARDAMPDYELMELVLFAGHSAARRQAFGKALIARFGSFADVIAAPRARLLEVDGIGEARRDAAEDRRGGGAAAVAKARC